ncbi:MAG: sodium:solute symporter family transporter [Brevinema sp.]
MSWHSINWIVIGVYFIGMSGIGWYFSKRHKSSDDYFTAKGRVPTIVAACSIYATMLSSLSYIAIPATIYRTNWLNGLAPLGIIALVISVAYLFVPFVRRLNVTTTYEYLEARFSRKLRILGSIVFILFHIIRIAIIIYLPTLALMVALPEVNPNWIVLATALFCVFYTSIGGIEGVVWSDFFQTIILIAGAFAVIYFGFSSVPAGENAFSILYRDDKILPPNAFAFDLSATTFWVVLIGGYMNSIYSYIGSQDVVQRYATVKNLKEAQKSLILNAPLLVISSIIFIGIGSAIYLFYKFNAPAPELARPDSILPFMVITSMPPFFSGLVIAGLLAASQSSVSSSLNSSATCIVTDLIAPLRPQIRDGSKLMLSKWVSLFIGSLSTGLALLFLNKGQSDMFFYIQVVTATLGGPIVVVFLTGIFFKRAGVSAAWIGFGTSTLLSLLLTDPGKILTRLLPSYTPPTLYAFSLPIIIIGGGVFCAWIASCIAPLKDNSAILPLTLAGLKDTSDIE